MSRNRTAALVVVSMILITGLALANPGKPNFTPQLYADGKAWGTKGAASLPAPNEHNAQSFDKLFVFTNAPMGQMPVAEAAPRNPSYNGGRWFTHTATWTTAGATFYMGNLPILTSYGEIKYNMDMGYLMVSAGSPAGGPPPYFECPLLPVKGGN
jgi:hypothetical protein